MNDLAVSELVEKVTAFIELQKDHFRELNAGSINRLDFARECEFAKQQLLKNDYIIGVARSNPDSLHAAISNVAAIGITLNPAVQFAYLVPRKVNKQPAICLDISYRGLTKLATDTGIVKAMKAELVYKADTFEYHGFNVAPTFQANPFQDRGELIGVYAMALLTDGNVLVETMTIDEVNRIRDDSEAYKDAFKEGTDSWKYKNNVWVKFYTEMVKKTVIKRAYKTLPTSKGTEIMGKAIEVINQHEGIEFQDAERLPELFYTDAEQQEYQRCIDESDFTALYCLIKSLSADAQVQLKNLCVPKAEHGMKGKKAKEFQENLDNGQMEIEATLAIVQQLLDENDDTGVLEIATESTEWETNYILHHITNEHLRQFQEILNQQDDAA